MSEWYYSKNKQQMGPVSETEIRALVESKQIGPTDIVWKEGMSDWVPASTVFPETQSAPTPPPRTAVTGSSTKVKAAVSQVSRTVQEKLGRYTLQQKLAVIGGLVVAVLVAIVGLWLFGSGGTGIKAHARYAPDDAVVVSFANMRQIRESEFFVKLREELDDEFKDAFEEMKDNAGLTLDDVESVSVWISEFDGRKPPTLVAKVTPDVLKDVEDAAEDMAREEDKVNDVTIYFHNKYEAVAVVEPDTVLVGHPDKLEDILDREGSHPEFNDEMQAGIDSTDFSHSVAVVGTFEDADAIEDEVKREFPGAEALFEKMGVWQVYGTVTDDISLSIRLSKRDSSDSLMSFSLSVDAVEMVDVVKSIQRAVKRRREELRSRFSQ